MNFFKMLTLFSVVSAEIQQAMSDRFVSLKEIVEIANSTLLQTTGKRLDEIGIKLENTEEGKTVLRIVF